MTVGNRPLPFSSKDIATMASITDNQGDLGKLRVLLADDHHLNRQLAKMFLAKLGIAAEIAEHGKEAFDRTRTEKFDIVLMDCQMPVMDGFEATRNIKELDDPPIVIAMTAHSRDEERRRCLDAGMDDYLTKPICSKLLKKTLLHWIGKIGEGL